MENPFRGQTNTSENITLPQLCWRAVKTLIPADMEKLLSKQPAVATLPLDQICGNTLLIVC